MRAFTIFLMMSILALSGFTYPEDLFEDSFAEDYDKEPKELQEKKEAPERVSEPKPTPTPRVEPRREKTIQDFFEEFPEENYEEESVEEFLSPSGSQSYHIGVGDLLQVEVYDEEDLTKEVRVLTDGSISFPLLGMIRASGITVSALEKKIAGQLGAKYLVNPQVTVFVKEFSNIFVFGEVIEPGSFPIYGNMTVFEAVTLAGGFTELANQSKVKVIRHAGGSERIINVDLEKLTKKGDSSQDVELQANDRVIVSRGFF